MLKRLWQKTKAVLRPQTSEFGPYSALGSGGAKTPVAPMMESTARNEVALLGNFTSTVTRCVKMQRADLNGVTQDVLSVASAERNILSDGSYEFKIEADLPEVQVTFDYRAGDSEACKSCLSGCNWDSPCECGKGAPGEVCNSYILVMSPGSSEYTSMWAKQFGMLLRTRDGKFRLSFKSLDTDSLMGLDTITVLFRGRMLGTGGVNLVPVLVGKFPKHLR